LPDAPAPEARMLLQTLLARKVTGRPNTTPRGGTYAPKFCTKQPLEIAAAEAGPKTFMRVSSAPLSCEASV
jgi:hypothetical protein